MEFSCFQFSSPIVDPKRRTAIKEEIKVVREKGTWDLVDLSKGKELAGCNWVHNIKHKALLSVIELEQLIRNGIDYKETFPGCQNNSIWVLLLLATNMSWKLHQ